MHAHTNYETDFYQWTQEQAGLLREGLLSTLDALHLAEEVESMGQNHRYALASYLENVLMRLLKWRYQPEKRTRSWQHSIWNGRDEIERLIQHNPSLRTHMIDILQAEYPRARRKANRETGLPLSIFPEACPFTMAEVLEDYWPEAAHI